MPPKRVVVDLDVGTDDAVALYILLHAEKLGDIKIEAFITTRGNSELKHTTRNLVRLLEIAGRTDIPVYRGSHRHLIRFPRVVNHFHGNDGLGDLIHATEPDMSKVKDELWISALYRLVKQNPNQISLICLGPLTNIAIPIRIYEDFSKNLQAIYIMGGNYTALGNITATSEFNFHCDPEAADIVLQCSECPITVVPWECCKKSDITFRTRFDVLGRMGGPLWDLITRSEKSVYGSCDLDDYWMPCDAFLVLVFLHPELAVLEKFKGHISVELHGQRTRGQVVVDHLNTNDSSTVIVQTVDVTFFIKSLMDACRGCLELHNKYRALHNAPPLKLDPKLVQKAEELVQVPLKGGALLESLYRPTYNINEFYINLKSHTAVLQPGTVIDTWYKQRSKHQFTNNAPLRIPARFFTQMVWKGTTHLGMACVTKEDGKWWAVGVYYPPGNVNGFYLENVEDLPPPPPPPDPPKAPQPIKQMTPEQRAKYDKLVAEYEAKKKRLDDAKKDSMCTKATKVLCCKPPSKKKKYL